jgi:hypothetical protein
MKRWMILLLLAATGAAHAKGDPANLHGEWRGQAQYQATFDRKPDPAAHVVTNLTIRVEPDGKVWGTSTENGCKLLGIGRPMSPTINVLNLDVTLSGCKYDGLNRRYSGTLAYYSTSNVQLSLRANSVGVGKAASFDVMATMRR